jgi:hypothetical protein
VVWARHEARGALAVHEAVAFFRRDEAFKRAMKAARLSRAGAFVRFLCLFPDCVVANGKVLLARVQADLDRRKVAEDRARRLADEPLAPMIPATSTADLVLTILATPKAAPATPEVGLAVIPEEESDTNAAEKFRKYAMILEAHFSDRRKMSTDDVAETLRDRKLHENNTRARHRDVSDVSASLP